MRLGTTAWLSESIPWAQAAQDHGTFKAVDDLRALYGGKGITPEKEVTAYCRIGERSAHTWFVLRELLGYENVNQRSPAGADDDEQVLRAKLTLEDRGRPRRGFAANTFQTG